MSLLNSTAIPTTWENVIYHLNGSCNSLAETLEAFEVPELEDNEDFLSYLDNEIFRCDSCNWWSPISEMSENGQWQCYDCGIDNEDE